jgi:predicted nucleic acid-binding protein
VAPQDRYWDTGPFLAWLKAETHRLADVEPVIRAAEAGKVRLVTSSVTLIEVVKLDQKNAPIEVPPDDAEKIRQFFLKSYISVRTFDRPTATLARQLIWDHGLTTRDAMHLATATRWRMPLLETLDAGDLIPLSGKVGDPAIEIRLPFFDPALAPADDEGPLGGLQMGMDFDSGAESD